MCVSSYTVGCGLCTCPAIVLAGGSWSLSLSSWAESASPSPLPGSVGAVLRAAGSRFFSPVISWWWYHKPGAGGHEALPRCRAGPRHPSPGFPGVPWATGFLASRNVLCPGSTWWFAGSTSSLLRLSSSFYCVHQPFLYPFSRFWDMPLVSSLGPF